MSLVFCPYYIFFLFSCLSAGVIIEKSPTYKPTNKNETLDSPDGKNVPESVMDIKGASLNTGGGKERL